VYIPAFAGSPDNTVISTPGIIASHFDVMGFTMIGAFAVCPLATKQLASIKTTVIHFFIDFSFEMSGEH
jgi:hypothetical protein